MFEWIPYFRAHNMNWFDPETGKYDGKEREPDTFAYYNAFAPSMTDMVSYNAEKVGLAIEMQALWRKIAEIELEGDYYPITECNGSTEDWYAMQFDDAAKRRGFVQIIRNADAKADTFTLVMPCIEDGAKYSISEGNFTSEELRKGIKIKLDKREAKVIMYTYS